MSDTIRHIDRTDTVIVNEPSDRRKAGWVPNTIPGSLETNGHWCPDCGRREREGHHPECWWVAVHRMKETT